MTENKMETRKTAGELLCIGFDYQAKGYELIGDWVVSPGKKVEYCVVIVDEEKIVFSKKILLGNKG